MKFSKMFAYRTGEVICLFLIAFYFSGGMPLLPASWAEVFDATPKVYRKLFVCLAAAAVIFGLILYEWARRDKEIGARSLIVKIIGTWKSASNCWIAAFFVVFGVWWTASSFLRHAAFKTSFDMAIFTQAVWNTTQGDWFYSSIKGGICLMGDHFAPFLALLSVPYRLWPEPGLLLAIQAFAAAACVFPLTRIVRKSGQSPSWAVLYCLAFALYLPVRNAVLFDFHPEVVAMPFLFWTFVFLDEKKAVLASLFLALALMAKENMATVAFGFGIYACFEYKSPLSKSGDRGDFRSPNLPPSQTSCFFPRMAVWAALVLAMLKLKGIGSAPIAKGGSERSKGSLVFGVFWIVFSVAYFFLVTRVLIPRLSGAPYFYLDGNFTDWLRLGWGPFAKHIFQASTFEYLAKIYGPLAFTSILAPAPFILTLPTLAQNLLSRNEMTRSLFFQYTATLTPFVFISSALTLAKVRSYRRYWAYAILLTSVLFSGVSEVYPMRRQWITITPHTAMVKKALAEIPANASLRTHEFYAPHAAHRKELHIYENNHPREGGSWKARQADYVVIDSALLKERYLADKQILLESGYILESDNDGLAIFRRSDKMILPDPSEL